MKSRTTSLRTPTIRQRKTVPDYDRYITALEARGWKFKFPGTHGNPSIGFHSGCPDKVIKVCHDEAWTNYARYCIEQYRRSGCRGTRPLLRVYSLRVYSNDDEGYCMTVAVIERLTEHERPGKLFLHDAFQLRWKAPRYWAPLVEFLSSEVEDNWDLHAGNFMVRTGHRGGKTMVCIDPIAYGREEDY